MGSVALMIREFGALFLVSGTTKVAASIRAQIRFRQTLLVLLVLLPSITTKYKYYWYKHRN